MDNDLLLSSLTREDKLLLLKKVIGYQTEPVDINTFITDDYYLGKITRNGKGIYPVWRDMLNEVYPDNITTKTFVCLNGAIRTGKSNTAKIMMLYDMYKLWCLGDNIYTFFELIPRPFRFCVAHQTKEKAAGLVKEIDDWMNVSPFFIEERLNPDSLINQFEVRPARSPDDFIGTNLCYFHMTECNYFVPVERGTDFINSAISRIETSTFRKGIDLFIHIILDSSDTSIEAVVPTFLKTHPMGRKAIQYRYSAFDAHRNDYFHIEDKTQIDNNETRFLSIGKQISNPDFGKPRKTFRIYKGDSEIHATIMPPYNNVEIKEETLLKMDPDNYIDVPLELLDNAKADLELFLNETCGVALASTMQYFNPQLCVSHFILPQLAHSRYSTESEDRIQVDFFDPEDTFINLLREAIESIPRDRNTFISIDLGLTGDRCGLSIGYIQDVCQRNVDGIVSYDPIMKVPISVGISRYVGQETSIQKLCDLIQYLHSKRPIYLCTTDTFQSYAIKQFCMSSEINHKFLSVDQPKTRYQLFKNLVYRGKVDMCDNKIMRVEMFNVYETEKKIDHHEVMNDAQEEGSNSKDILDSCCQCVNAMYDSVQENPEEVMQPMIVTESQFESMNRELIKQMRKKNNMNKALRGF